MILPDVFLYRFCLLIATRRHASDALDRDESESIRGTRHFARERCFGGYQEPSAGLACITRLGGAGGSVASALCTTLAN